jgi:hypothetical protein
VVLFVQALAALGLPLALLVLLRWDGTPESPGGVPGLSIASLFVYVRVLSSLFASHCGSQSNVRAAAGGVSLRIAGARPPVAPAPAAVVSCSLQALTRRMHRLP